MESVESYRAAILAIIRPLPPAEISLEAIQGTVLARDAVADWPIPGFDNSGMDGYAVRACDVAAATQQQPARLPVDAEVAAGDTAARTLAPGRAIKIMTGAPLPSGTDAVVPVEWTDAANPGSTVSIRQAAGQGNAVRRAGADAKPGDVLLAAGTLVGAAQIGLLAAAGLRSLQVRGRPRVTVFSTGNELAEPGDPLLPGQIWDSNSHMLVAAARTAGGDATRHPAVRDSAGAVLTALQELAAGADLLITTGGVSMGGEHDVVKAALSKLGTVSFRKVAMQPGMPQGFGLIGDAATPILTLPGNPVSAYVSFLMFAAPALRALQQLEPRQQPMLRAALSAPVRSPQGRRSYLRGVLDAGSCTIAPMTGQESNRIASLGRANALIVVPEPVTALPAGETVDVLELP